MVLSLQRHAAIAAVGCILFISIVITAANAVDTTTREQRHNIPPVRKHAQVIYPQSQESADMISPCKPERDGYFGSTSGNPTMIQYGFEIESIINRSADITDALDAIRERVMDVILSYSFPTICTLDRDLSRTNDSSSSNNNRTILSFKIDSVTGFHFEDDYDAVQSCLPQQSILNDCSTFTGLISVYGSEVTTNTSDTILQIFQLEFPSFRLRTDSNSNVANTIYDNDDNTNNSGNNNLTVGVVMTRGNGDDTTVSKLIQYGITRLNISESYMQVILRPSDPASDRIGLDFNASARNIIVIALMILCIVVGIYIIGRYLYTQRQIHHYDDRFDTNVKKPDSEPNIFGWKFFSKKDETDITEASCSTSSSLSVNSWGTHENSISAIRKVRAMCNITRRHQMRQKRSRPESMEFTLSGGVSSMMDADSIYIVESDDEDDNEDYNGILQESQRSHTPDSQLESNDFDRYTFDPLQIASSSESDSRDMIYEY